MHFNDIVNKKSNPPHTAVAVWAVVQSPAAHYEKWLVVGPAANALTESEVTLLGPQGLRSSRDVRVERYTLIAPNESEAW